MTDSSHDDKPAHPFTFDLDGKIHSIKFKNAKNEDQDNHGNHPKNCARTANQQ